MLQAPSTRPQKPMYGKSRKPGPDVRNTRAVSLNVKIVFVVRSSNITVRESGPRPAVATMVVTRVCMHRSRSTAAPCALVVRRSTQYCSASRRGCARWRIPLVLQPVIC